jgi:hypothetical protein
MTPRPKLKDLIIGTATILTILGFIFYMDRFTLPNGYGTDMNPFFTYDHNIGIITISSNKLLFSLIILATLTIWLINKRIIGKKAIIVLCLSSISIGLLSWIELWYGSTFYYGEVRDKQGLMFPFLSVLYFAYPIWNIKISKNNKIDSISKCMVTLILGIVLYVFFKAMEAPWNLIQS